MMARVFLFMLFAWLFTACKYNDDRDEEIDRITSTLNRASTLVNEYNEKVYTTLHRKLGSARTRAKAEIWYPKAVRVKQLSSGFYAYIDSLQKQVSLPGTTAKEVRRLLNKESDRLHKELVAFYQIDSIVDTAEFDWNTLYVETLKRDMRFIRKFVASRLQMGNDSSMSSYTDARQLARSYFDNATPAQASMVLSKFRYDILEIESCLVDYLNLQAVDNYCGFTPFSVMGEISTKHVKAGQTIEIYAGRGIYSNEIIPKVTIFDSIMPIGPQGTGSYSFIAKGEPGKHMVPVYVEYYKPGGEKVTVTKKLEYIIAE